jgi:hypothetical protein
MIVVADLDLTESGVHPHRPENVAVLIHAGEDSDSLAEQIDKATAAIARCRLIREGNVYETTIQHSVSAGIIKHLYAYRMDETGEIWTEETGRFLP